MNKHRPRLRAPFVATVVAGAALTGCGLTVVTPSPRCPVEAPVDGSACDPAVTAAGTCGYGACHGVPITQATCDPQRRTWSVSTLRCAIDPPVRSCPAAQPAEGAACDPAFDPASCNYGWSECARGPSVTALCEGNAWRLAVATCNPPPPTCPAQAPQRGTSCVLLPGTQCTYGDCYGSPTTWARCESGTWQVAEASCNPPPPVCPAEAPRNGDPCGLPTVPSACTWGDCEGAPTTFARCVAGRWYVETRTCDTPPVACPGRAPIEGDPCVYPPSATCDYGSCGEVPALTYTCRDGRWALQRAMCGDYCPPTRPLAGTACSRDALAPCRYPGAVCDGMQLSNEASCNPMTHRWVITEYACR